VKLVIWSIQRDRNWEQCAGSTAVEEERETAVQGLKPRVSKRAKQMNEYSPCEYPLCPFIPVQVLLRDGVHRNNRNPQEKEPCL
jgi:hypothetical protein